MLPEFLKEITVTTNERLQMEARGHNLMRQPGFHMSMTGLCVRRALLEWCCSHPGHAPMPAEEIDEIVTLKSRKERDLRSLGFFKVGNRVQDQLQREFAIRKLLYAGRDVRDKELRCYYDHFKEDILPLDFHEYPELLFVHGEADLIVGNNEDPNDLLSPAILIECKSTSRKDADRMDSILASGIGIEMVEAKSHHALQTGMYLNCLNYIGRRELAPVAFICYWCREDERKHWASVDMSVWPRAVAWWDHTFNTLERLMKAQTLKWVGDDYPELSVHGCMKQSWECRWGKSPNDTCDFYNFCYHTKGGSSGKRKSGSSNSEDFGSEELNRAFLGPFAGRDEPERSSLE